jgi:hypothetical protein
LHVIICKAGKVTPCYIEIHTRQTSLSHIIAKLRRSVQ